MGILTNTTLLNQLVIFEGKDRSHKKEVEIPICKLNFSLCKKFQEEKICELDCISKFGKHY